MTTAPTSTDRAASAACNHRKAAPHHRLPGGLFTAEHAYAVRLVKIATATSDAGSGAELKADNKTEAGIVRCAAYENDG
jgi:hypothetical protein